MGFWMLAGLLALLIGAALILAAWQRRDAAAPNAAYDLQVYRDQLRGVDKDVARGVLTEAEAAQTRTEISRRILEADRALQGEGAEAHAARPQQVAIVVLVGLVLAGAVALYTRIGAPGYPDLPIDTRIAIVEEQRAARASQAEAEAQVPPQLVEEPDPRRAELVQQLRATMQDHPDEPRGLRLLAFEEARIGNFAAARAAQEHLLEVLGDETTAADVLALAETNFMAAGGYVSPEAERLLNRVLGMDPGNLAARYYIGLMYAQQGRPDLGYPIWRNVLAESAPGDPWLRPIRQQIEEVAARAGDRISVDELRQPPMQAPEGAPFAGPSQGDIEAAGDMSPEERQAMIEGMVAGLADRLATEGGPPADWARLIGANQVLGRVEDAQAIYDEALTVFADNDGALSVIRQAGADLEQPE